MPVATDFDIGNMALNVIGVTKAITSLTDGSTEATTLNRWYAAARKDALSSYPWRFAVKIDQLVEYVSSVPSEYATYYDIPAGMLYPLRIIGAERRPPVGERVPFAIVADVVSTTDKIATDYSSTDGTYLEYIKDITDVTTYPDYFVEYMAALLALRVAIPITKSVDMLKAADQAVRIYSARAFQQENFGVQQDPEPESVGVRIRG